MAKKLIIVWLSITIITFSSISIYATQTKGDFFIPNTAFVWKSFNLFTVHENHDFRGIWEGKESRTRAVENTAKKTAGIAESKKEKKNKEKYSRGLARYIRTVNRNVSKEDAGHMAKYFVKYADKYNVKEELIMAVAQNESTFYCDVVSSCGHKGLMQVSDGIAENAGYTPDELFNPEVSIKVGARYLSIKMEEFGSSLLALTAYNQGSGSVNSGNYSTAYAELAMSRADDINNFLKENGYVE